MAAGVGLRGKAMNDISRTHVPTGSSTRTEAATNRAPAAWAGCPGHEPRPERRGRRRALIALILLSWGSLLGLGAYPDEAFGDQEGPPDCTAIIARGFPVYRQLSATYQWLGSCTPHGLRWSVDFHATTKWSRPSNGVVGTFEEQITIERFTPGAEPSNVGEFPVITIQTKGLCGDDPWLTTVECRDFSVNVTSLESPRIPTQLKLMVEAWSSTRPPLTQPLVGDRTGLVQNRQRQLEQEALAARKTTSPAPATTAAGRPRMVSLLEPAANAILFGPGGVRVRVARPQEASTSYVFQFMKDKTSFVNTWPTPAGSAEAGVLVTPGVFQQVAWRGRWLVRVRVGGGGDVMDSPRDYPWSEWRPFELRQPPPVTTTPKSGLPQVGPKP